MRDIRIAAIVPTLDEATEVAAAVRALGAEADEVIVADGGSRDDTVALARSVGARVIASGRGYAAQCNAASRVTDADVLWFIAADSRVGAGAGRSIRDALRSATVRYGGAWLRIADPAPVFRFVEFGGNVRALRHRLALPDQGLFVRAADFHAVGGMPAASIPHAALCALLSGRGEFRLLSPATETSSRKWRCHGFWRVARAHGSAYRSFRRRELAEFLESAEHRQDE
jgi:glycosyltransferase involved in cell wall biosynthesis